MKKSYVLRNQKQASAPTTLASSVIEAGIRLYHPSIQCDRSVRTRKSDPYQQCIHALASLESLDYTLALQTSELFGYSHYAFKCFDKETLMKEMTGKRPEPEHIGF